ncbi:transcription antitermination protein NusB [Patescibacteria group bacterium]|nr:transcription antitermination protein NusB [Patescibacteria group bacterium]MCL5409952.1 transcription antitermination protein NusB [Patescibacteria group bacterium]
MKSLFAWDFHNQDDDLDNSAKDVINHIELINSEIGKAAAQRPLKEINKIDLAILRLAVYELLVQPKLHSQTREKNVPYKVITDESVELAKEFGSESSPSFVNGVLGNIISEHHLDELGSI